MNKEKKYELIRFEDDGFSLDVNVSPDEDTVWLTQEQISKLFDKARNTITEHINNIFGENELNENTCVGISDISGNHRPAKLYNLDVILAVGYRVNSKRGILFRRWANSVLKQYLLTGVVVDKERIISYQSNILRLEADYVNIENRLKKIEDTVYADNNQLIFEGEIIEPYSFLIKLFFLAKKKITIIDNYADDFLLSMLKEIKVPVTIYTIPSTYINANHLQENIKIVSTTVFHDRYIIIDDTSYTMGSSFNSIGKKRFCIAKLIDISEEMILKNIKK